MRNKEDFLKVCDIRDLLLQVVLLILARDQYSTK